MKLFFHCVYVLLLVILGLTSITITWASDSAIILMTEIFIDAALICGYIMFMMRKKFKPWLIVFVIAAVGQVALLIIDQGTTLIAAIAWIIILIPAYYGNYKISATG